MIHPMRREDFRFTTYDLDKAVEEVAKVARLPMIDRSNPSYVEGGSNVYVRGYRSIRNDQIFVFDLAGLSLDDTAQRFLNETALGDWGDHVVYVAPSFSLGFMADLCERRAGASVHFMHIPDDSTEFKAFDLALAVDHPSIEDDSSLERALMGQARPEKPRTLEEARELVEGYVAKALEKDMTPPEARVEAMRVCAWLETLAKEKAVATRTAEDN